jgi:hypothetical protein
MVGARRIGNEVSNLCITNSTVRSLPLSAVAAALRRVPRSSSTTIIVVFTGLARAIVAGLHRPRCAREASLRAPVQGRCRRGPPHRPHPELRGRHLARLMETAWELTSRVATGGGGMATPVNGKKGHDAAGRSRRMVTIFL